MVVTLTCTSEGERHLEIRCKDQRFIKEHGDWIVAVDGKYIYRILLGMTEWVNNQLKEELLVEIE